MKIKSELYLLQNVELDSNYNYTIDFETIEEQATYFDNKIDTTFKINDDYSYIKDNTIRIDGNVENFIDNNYLYFINENKRYYAFIIDKNYISNDTTELIIKIDTLQTYMFDYELNEVFVDREHEDRYFKLQIGDNKFLHPLFNIEPENLNVGTEPTQISNSVITDNIDDIENEIIFMEVVATEPLADFVKGGYNSNDPTTYKNKTNKLNQYGLNLGIYTYIMPISFKRPYLVFYTYNGNGEIKNLFNANIFNKSTAILSIRLLKYSPIDYNLTTYKNGYLITFKNGYTNNSETNKNVEPSVSMRVIEPNNDNFGGINTTEFAGANFLALSRIDKTNDNTTMVNKIEQKIININDINFNNKKNKFYETKLLTYPYFYYQICDYQSQPLQIKNENILLESKIKIKQCLGIQAKSKVYLSSYLGDDNGKEHNSINSTISELPILNDAFVSYMAQNKASATTGQALNVGSGIASLGIGIATGGVGLAIAGTQALGIGAQIANQLIKIQDLKDTPDSVRQMGNNAEFDIADENFKYILKSFAINQKFSDKIYNYFYHYGYKCNDFKIPNLKSRYYFNYIKTIGCTIKCNFNNEIRNEICNIYDNGITIWHYRDASTFKGINNYEFENAELSLIGG